MLIHPQKSIAGMLRLAGMLAGLVFFLAAIFFLRCQNHPDVFVDQQVYFIDADCYSRMTRVRMVMENPGQVIRHHRFENHPEGTTPHTTVPLDYLIALLAAGLKPFTAQPLDLAGAWISPLLAVMTGAFLWGWSRGTRFRWMGLLMFAVSPVLVHGTALGRPDHQALLIALLAVALGSEWKLIQQSSRGWSLANGAAWGMALWVSLYEPLILLALVLLVRAVFKAHDFKRSDRLAGGALLIFILLVAWLVEGWRIALPGGELAGYFENWKRSIGELASVTPLSPLLYRWTGFGLIILPILLLWQTRKDRRAGALFVILIAVYLLTLWQIRWGYFLALIFAMILPAQLPAVRHRALIWGMFILSLWPVASEWEERLFPEEQVQSRKRMQRLEAQYLRDAAEQMKGSETLAVLAPWWLSPPVAYWSQQPAIGGSSHQSLPGNVVAARFYLTEDFQMAKELLEKRQVKRVLIADPEQTLQTSAGLLNEPVRANPLGKILDERPYSAPPFLQLEYQNPFFKLFRVMDPVVLEQGG